MRLVVTLMSICVAAAGHAQSLEHEEWAEDISYLVEFIENRHPDPYQQTTREAFHQRATEIAEGAAVRGDAQTAIELANLVASLGQTHSYFDIWSAHEGQRVVLTQFGIRVRFFEDGFFVTDATDVNRQFVGARLETIGGEAVQDVFARLRGFVFGGDNPYIAPFINPQFLVMPDVLVALGVADTDGVATFEFVQSTGERVTRRFQDGLVDPVFVGDSRDESLLVQSLYWRDPDELFWVTRLDDQNAIYLQLNSIDESEVSSFGGLAGDLRALASAGQAERVVIDLRRNIGGNGQLTYPLLRELVRLDACEERGGIVVLAGAQTLSASVVFLIELEKLCDVRFVGMPTGSNRAQWGDNVYGVLPHSGLHISSATAFYENGGPYPPRGAIMPDVAIWMTGAEFFEGSDGPLDVALGEIDLRNPGEVYWHAARGDADALAALTAFVNDERYRYREFERPLRLLAEEVAAELGAAEASAITDLLIAQHPDRARSYMAHAEQLEALGQRTEAREYWAEGAAHLESDDSLYRDLRRRMRDYAAAEIERLSAE